jgi:ADP-heptose:LPS heptosyltransferase
MMDIGLMRSVDRYLGIPLCWLTGIASRILRRRAPSPDRIRTILVMKFFGMGSILLATPFLSSLRKAFPSAKIVFVSFDGNRELLERLPYGLDVRTVSTETATSFIRDSLSVLRFLRRAGIDVVCDLEFFSKFSTLLSTLAGARIRIGYELPTFWRKTNLTHPVPLDRSAHVADIFLRQCAALGIPAEELPIARLDATPGENRSMTRKLGLDARDVDVITMNINAGKTSLERRWEPANFAAVAEALLADAPRRRFFLIGSADERPYNEALLQKYPHLAPWMKNCAGQLTCGELIALLQRSSVIITNDSGPMHLAAAGGTPIVALFGPEAPEFYGPRGTARVLYKGIECSPCLNIYNAKIFACPFNAKCMREISVPEVLLALQSLHPTDRLVHA